MPVSPEYIDIELHWCIEHDSPMGRNAAGEYSNFKGIPFACTVNIEWDQIRDCKFGYEPIEVRVMIDYVIR